MQVESIAGNGYLKLAGFIGRGSLNFFRLRAIVIIDFADGLFRAMHFYLFNRLGYLLFFRFGAENSSSQESQMVFHSLALYAKSTYHSVALAKLRRGWLFALIRHKA
jgi:hypothetical protein